MEDFPSNSHENKLEAARTQRVSDDRNASNRPARERQKSVVSEGAVRRRKRTRGSRLVELFGGFDARSAVESVIRDVLVPAAKDMVADAISQGVERTIFGEARSTTRRSTTSRGPVGNSVRVDYNRASTQSNRRDSGRHQVSRRSPDYEEFEFETRREASDVLDQMYDHIERYDTVSLADLYDFVNLTGEHTDEKWGWTDLRGSDVRRTRSGYTLKLPRLEDLS